MSEAIWRGNRIKVLSATTVRAVIVTPLGIKLSIRAAELSTATAVGKPQKDSRKF